ncbi:hypothetical protein EVAR_3779_1 [Eumeta japonica]|uniref:Uncharacterized protein n=1 Tax=Eumeta variegata TaxID=151549 RepID=A0A4C1SRU8_EUMVA|nr:hypothetical protein EVAR_3779_1 [Eumeta japonica]
MKLELTKNEHPIIDTHTHTAEHSVIDRTLLSADQFNYEREPGGARSHQPCMPVDAYRTSKLQTVSHLIETRKGSVPPEMKPGLEP